MTEDSKEIRSLFDNEETDFLLSRTRVTMRSSLENIEAGEFKIQNLREGQIVELPRWVAEELVQLNLAESGDEPFETEVYRALSREKMMGPFQLSALSADFYMRMRRRLAYLSAGVKDGKVRKEDHDKVRSSCYDLIGMRLGKLLSLSSTSSNSNFVDKLTPEEKVFFSRSQGFSKDWRDAIFLEGT